MIVGIKDDQYSGTPTQGHSKSIGTDFYIKLGNGDITIGRLMVARESLGIVQNNRIYSGDLKRCIVNNANIDYLEIEKDTMDNRAFVLFRKIESITDPIMKNKDDYLKEILPREKLLFTNLFGEDFILINNLQKNGKTPRVEIDDNVFTLIN